MRDQPVIGGQQVAQVVFARHPRQRNTRAGVTSQVEGQAYTTQARNTFGPLQVTLLTAAPAVHKQHAGHLGFGAQERAAHLFVVDIDRNAFASSRHKN